MGGVPANPAGQRDPLAMGVNKSDFFCLTTKVHTVEYRYRK